MRTCWNPRRLANPDTLRQIRRDLLLAWLGPAAGYLARRGLSLPAPDSEAPVPCEQLAAVFLDPTPDMPPALVDSLFLLHGMATSAGLDILREGAQRNGLGLELADDQLTPADAAVKMWLADPALLENLHNCQELTRPRSFRYFTTDAHPLPAFAGPARRQIAALEERLTRFYLAWKRGPGARVFPYREEHEWWFLVRHGAPCRREGALENGRPTTIFYRPQRHDVLVYDPVRGELRLHCCAERERRVLLRVFGACLFGRPDFFPGTAKYTLAPLVRRGRDCLACADVPGLEQVRLTEVEFYFRARPWKRVIHKCDDVFSLVERAEIAWPEKLEDIARATFEVKFLAAKASRRLTIVPCNQALYGRDGDSSILETWLAARRFVTQKPDDLLTNDCLP